MSSPLTKALADAITKQEGFFPGSASHRNNNPGNIMDIVYYQQTGKFKLATYPTLEAGREALERLVDKYIAAGHTLTSFFAKYAPSGHGDNSPSTYAKNVASWLGIPADVPLSQITATTPSASASGAETPAEGESGLATLPILAAVGAVGAFLWWWMGD